jgi:hypothetical protein
VVHLKGRTDNVMFTAFVLMCAQNMCFAVGGPSFPSYEQCVGDFMQNGVMSLQMKYPGYEITAVECHEWKKKVES